MGSSKDNGVGLPRAYGLITQNFSATQEVSYNLFSVIIHREIINKERQVLMIKTFGDVMISVLLHHSMTLPSITYPS